MWSMRTLESTDNCWSGHYINCPSSSQTLPQLLYLWYVDFKVDIEFDYFINTKTPVVSARLGGLKQRGSKCYRIEKHSMHSPPMCFIWKAANIFYNCVPSCTCKTTGNLAQLIIFQCFLCHLYLSKNLFN